MIILRDSSPVPASCKHAVLALGNFDGLHLGHQSILQETLTTAKETGKPAGVLTFEPHPRRVFRPELPQLRIYTFREKARLLAEAGIDFMRVVRFTKAFSETSAEDFVTKLLHQQMNVSHVVTGEDFIFGHNRTGNAALLSKMATELGFGTTACKAVLQEGERCSSTRLRALLAEGNVSTLSQLTGRAYSITGHVREGDKRGRTLGFPTANIIPATIFLPATGVYAVTADIDGKRIKGVAHLGARPVFGSTQMRLETHFFDWSGDLYGKRLRIDFIARIRGDVDISSVEELKSQIARDCETARIILKN